MTPVSNAAELPVQESKPSRYRWYVLIVLALTYTSSYMDRQIVTILLENIREEFALSDTQLGLLSGIAFSIFYATLGIPIARLADRVNRINIIAIAVTVWSGMTILCSTASSFTQLFIARVGVGVGEAGGTPPAHSVISDYFPVHERSFAISIYSLGTAIGALCGLVLGGFIAQYYGWRTAFVVAGVPGIAIAVLVKLTVREPLRGAMDEKPHAANDGAMATRQAGAATATGQRPAQAGTFSIIARLWQNPVYSSVAIAHVLAVFVAYAISAWLPTLYLRQFELGQGMVGTIVGLLNLVGGVSGLLVGGYLADRLGKRDIAWYGRLPALTLLLAFPVLLLALWAQNIVLVSVLFGLAFFLYQASHGPGLAIVQLVADSGNRAQAAAFVFFLTNLLGLGIGPLLVGIFSDLGSSVFADASLAVAMGGVSSVLLVASFCFWRTGQKMREQHAGQAALTSAPTSR